MSTSESSKTLLQVITQQPNPEVVGLLKRMLSYAEAGELTGFVAFCCHTGRENAFANAGDVNFADTVAAFEDWKFKALWRRNRTDEP